MTVDPPGTPETPALTLFDRLWNDAGLPRAARGTYCLGIWNERAGSTRVGALGIVEFPRGWYAYAGSALGRGATSLRNRLRRHLREASAKTLHWHVDYLLALRGTRLVHAWLLPGPGSRIPEVPGGGGLGTMECRVSHALARVGRSHHPGFGNSDCNACKSHLYALGAALPALETVVDPALADLGTWHHFHLS